MKDEREQAQTEVLNSLVDLAELGGYMEKETVMQALTILHNTIFSVKFPNVKLYSERALKWLSDETEIAWEAL